MRSRGVTVVVHESVRVLEQPDATEFCRGMWPRLVGALSLAVGDPLLAEELAQEALSRVVQRWDKVAAMDDPAGYTFRVGFNLGRSWWRRRAAETRAHIRIQGDARTNNEDLAHTVAVRQALLGLPRRQREVLVHRYFLGHTVAETAHAMICKEGTVKALTSQAISTLRARGLGLDDE